MTGQGRRHSILMLLENNPYPQDTRVRNEAEALVGAGHRVTVLAPRAAGQPRSERLGGVDVRRFWLPQANGTAASFLAEYLVAHLQLGIRALGRMRRTTVLHLHNPPDTLFASGMLARLMGRRVVFDLHDLAPELFAVKFRSRKVESVLVAAQKLAMWTASRVVVTNETQRELAIGRGRVGHDHVAVVRNGPRSETLVVGDPPRPGVLEAPKLVFVGLLDVQDGILDLADLLAHEALSRATLTVIGDGPSREDLARRAEALGVADRLVLTGRVEHSRVPALIAEADIAVDPAPGTPLNHGSTMIKISEYLAAGRPVVAYELRETRRTAGEAALYAPCGDSDAFARLVARVAADGDLRRSLHRAARERAPDLVWERSAPVLVGLYAGL